MEGTPLTPPYYTDESVTLYHSDCLDVLRTLPDCSVDSVVTDPPYGLEFMGKGWDAPWQESDVNADAGFADIAMSDGYARLPRPSFTGSTNPKCLNCGGTRRGRRDGTADRAVCLCDAPRFPNTRAVEMRAFQEWCEAWSVECLRVLKPGGYLISFGGTRTWHRLACAIEDAGFEIRDSIAWLTGQGFPKSLGVSKDKACCQCQVGESTYGSAQRIDPLERRGPNDPMRPLWADGQAVAESDQASGDGVLLVQLPVDGPCGDAGSESPRPDREAGGAAFWGSEPGMEGRGDLSQGEGQLRRPEVRPLSGGVSGDGPQGRLHHGAPSGNGSLGETPTVADGSGEPHQPQHEGQQPGELGVVSEQRGSQAWRGWPVCPRCAKPVIPAGLGTALKPAFEPIVVGRKPLIGTVAANVLAHGTGALNIDGCRVDVSDADRESWKRLEGFNNTPRTTGATYANGKVSEPDDRTGHNPTGRWPANVVLDGSQADALDAQSGITTSSGGANGGKLGARVYGTFANETLGAHAGGLGDTGGASRYFPTFRYEAKAPSTERPSYVRDGVETGRVFTGLDGKVRQCNVCETRAIQSGASEPSCGHGDFRWEAPTLDIPGRVAHPTVKPLALMQWLVRLVTPPGGVVLEPFAGSGTTAEACVIEGFRCIAIEREADYLSLIVQRVSKPLQVTLDFGV